MITRLIRTASLLATTVVVALAFTACTGSPTSRLKAACVEAVAVHAGVEVAEVVVTSTLESPGGSLDWYGEFTGGWEFACAAGKQEETLYSVMVYAPDGMPSSVDF